MLMLYWVYEELEYSPEKNVEIFLMGWLRQKMMLRYSVNAKTLYYLQ